MSSRVSGLEGSEGPTQQAPGVAQRADQVQAGALSAPVPHSDPEEGAQPPAGETLHGDSE